jgi:hypothetical protein
VSTNFVYKLLDSKQAAGLLGISEKTLRKDRSEHHLRIPFLRFGRRVKYDERALTRWIAARIEHLDKGAPIGRPPRAVEVARERAVGGAR